MTYVGDPYPLVRSPWPAGTADKAPDLSDAEEDVVARFVAACPAPESFIHLGACTATDDAPDVCECPPAVLR